MANINRVVLVGNLTRDPELRTTPTGTSVCKLRIAVHERAKDSATGQRGDRANYFDVTVWGAQGESCTQYLAKALPIAVDGRLQWREWDAQDDTNRQADRGRLGAVSRRPRPRASSADRPRANSTCPRRRRSRRRTAPLISAAAG